MKWILLRGLARQSKHWGDYPQAMIDSGVAEVAYALDAPGVGEKFEQFSPLKIESYVKYMRPEFQTIRRQNPGPWGVLGISMGAMIAMKWIELYPQDFSTGVFINTSASNFSAAHKRMSISTMKSIARIAFNKSLEERERFIYQLTSHLESSNELSKVAEWVKISREHPISKLNFISQLIAAAKFKAPRSIGCPSLFLISQKDQLADSGCGIKLAEHFRSSFEMHPEAGHDLPLDDSEWVNQKIKNFMKSIENH